MKWLRPIRGAVGMGATWAVAWAVAGLLIGVTSILVPGSFWDAFLRIYDAPLPTLAIPGFVGGVLFSMVLGIAARHRSFDELSLPRFAAWGALGGLLLSLVPLALVSGGLKTANDDLWRFTAMITGPIVILSAASASVSLMVARRAVSKEMLSVGRDVAEVIVK